MTYQEKVEKYRNSEYVWEKPYPIASRWTEEDFIRRIDLTDGWVFHNNNNRKDNV